MRFSGGLRGNTAVRWSLPAGHCLDGGRVLLVNEVPGEVKWAVPRLTLGNIPRARFAISPGPTIGPSPRNSVSLLAARSRTGVSPVRECAAYAITHPKP